MSAPAATEFSVPIPEREKQGTPDQEAGPRLPGAAAASPVIPALLAAAHPPRSRREEVLNCLTHGVGLALSLAGLPVLIALASTHGGHGLTIASCGVYGAALIALYGASTFYHGVAAAEWKDLLRKIDHSTIYILIAGTYTPFSLVSLGGGWGVTLFALVWGLAAAGILCKVFARRRNEALSTVTYVLMGWIGLLAFGPIHAQFPAGCIGWLLAGGICYTAGVPFYALDRRPYLHVVWHLFVLAGSASHFVAVVNYVVPPA